jgi:NitT/TauT family transport system ATP-binding protein
LAEAALAPSGPASEGGAKAPPLRVVHVSKSYEVGDHLAHVIRDLTLTLNAGEIVSIVGPSGCGKSTLLNVVSGLLPPTSGEVFWYGERLVGVPARAGYMLQKDLLLPWRTALANVVLGLELQGVEGAEARDRAEIMLDRLGLHGFANAYPATLSGGQRQRVALARTLVTDPDVMLLDEPFAALDFQSKLLIENDTAALVRGEHRAVLLITHDVEEAVSMSDRVLVLSQRPTYVVRTYDIDLPGSRTDMMEARKSPGFQDAVRAIWDDLQIGGQR